MRARLLPSAEWPRLVALEPEAAVLWPYLDPHRNAVAVVEDGDQIVGRLALMSALHAECLWIDPTRRKRGAVGRALLGALSDYAKSIAAPTVCLSAMTTEMEKVAIGLKAQRLPGMHYVLATEGLSWPRR